MWYLHSVSVFISVIGKLDILHLNYGELSKIKNVGLKIHVIECVQ